MSLIPLTSESPAPTTPEVTAVPIASEAVTKQADGHVSDIQKFLGLVPSERQAMAGNLLIAVINDERDDVLAPGRSAIAIGRGTKYRASETPTPPVGGAPTTSLLSDGRPKSVNRPSNYQTLMGLIPADKQMEADGYLKAIIASAKKDAPALKPAILAASSGSARMSTRAPVLSKTAPTTPDVAITP